ncbi:MAG: amidohydrolase family protein [Alphaproteobacteria bacterium]|jgi:predicted TIM-barrel fold metal-dependent hydrolase|nr:amidohydrolase family protein [Alphaproteobacteria bacterium]
MATKSTNAEWLAQVVEETIDPELPICDPHHHLWEFKYERVAHRYLLDEILEDLNSGHNVVSTVFIECGAMIRAHGPVPLRMVGETEFVNGIAAMSASGEYGKARVAAGIVGHADLCLGADVAGVLEAHLLAGGGRFRGIRHSCTWDAAPDVPNARCEPPQHLYQQENFRAGFAQLARHDMSFEGWCYHTQIAELTELAQAFPDTTIILDHFGGPLGIGPYEGKLEENFAQWQSDISDLARCENVVAKLGGINMELNGFGWHERDRPPSSEELMLATKPYYEHTIEQFGAGRCMFESNFPVDMCSCSYNVLWNSFKRLTADYSADEKAKLFHDTATRIYRLDNTA